jgi:hypothetical protein
MGDGLKVIIAGVIGIGLVTAFGLHSRQLAQLPKPTGQAFSGVLSTAETGQA